jgi:nitrogen regulatory protein PII 1
MVMVVVEEKDASKAMDAIAKAAKTGNYGDGKIFVSPVETAYTIRTGEEGL